MSNPPLLFCDSDALIQIFLTDQQKLLKSLTTRYGIQPVLVFEAYNELMQHRKYKNHISARFLKTLNAGVIKMFDSTFCRDQLKTHGVPQAAIDATWQTIQSKGEQYEVHVGPGEAFTFAAAVSLEMPALSHDSQALHTLLNHDMATPVPVLRLFDLMVLFNQVGELSDKDCDLTRSTLTQFAEGVPREFANASYTVGLPNYSSRILDYTVATLGSEPRDQRPFAKLLYVKPLPSHVSH